MTEHEREMNRIYKARYRERHKERVRQYQREYMRTYRADHPDRIQQAMKNYAIKKFENLMKMNEKKGSDTE